MVVSSTEGTLVSGRISPTCSTTRSEDWYLGSRVINASVDCGMEWESRGCFGECRGKGWETGAVKLVLQPCAAVRDMDAYDC